MHSDCKERHSVVFFLRPTALSVIVVLSKFIVCNGHRASLIHLYKAGRDSPATTLSPSHYHISGSFQNVLSSNLRRRSAAQYLGFYVWHGDNKLPFRALSLPSCSALLDQ